MPKRNPALFVHCADSHRVLLFAVTAAPQEPLIALAGLGILHFVDFDRAALDAAGSIAPTQALEQFDGGKLIGARRWNVFDNRGFREIVTVFLHASNFILSAIVASTTKLQSG